MAKAAEIDFPDVSALANLDVAWIHGSQAAIAEEVALLNQETGHDKAVDWIYGERLLEATEARPSTRTAHGKSSRGTAAVLHGFCVTARALAEGLRTGLIAGETVLVNGDVAGFGQLAGAALVLDRVYRGIYSWWLVRPWAGPDDAGGTRGLTETDEGRSIVSGPVIMGGAFGSFAAARSRRSWLATRSVMSV